MDWEMFRKGCFLQSAILKMSPKSPTERLRLLVTPPPTSPADLVTAVYPASATYNIHASYTAFFSGIARNEAARSKLEEPCQITKQTRSPK